MGQREVLEYMKELRKKGEDWYTISQIKEGLKAQGHSNGSLQGLFQDLYRLVMFKYVEIRGIGLWNHQKEFRAILR